MKSISQWLYVAARQDLATFVKLIFEELYGENSLEMNWHIEVVCYDLEKTVTGVTRRLIVNLPPRHLKSFIASVAYPLWLLARSPSIQIMCVSYGDDLVEEFGKQRLAVVQGEMFGRIFPDFALRKRDQSNTSLGSTRGGKVFGLSLGGGITGRGCDVLILDDPMKADKALSDSTQDSTMRTFQNTLVTRLNNQKRGVIVLVMQRLHDRDLTALVQPLFDWKIRSIPALATTRESYKLKSGSRHVREKGDPIQPSRMSRATLRAQRRAIGTIFFEAQYQQKPIPIGGGIIKLEDFQRYSVRPALRTFDSITLSIDPASSINPKADYSVITVWGTRRKKFYLLHLYRKQRTKPQLQRDIIRLRRRWGADLVLIEKDGIGTAIFQDLRHKKMEGIFAVAPKNDKQIRLAWCLGMIEDGDVLLPEAAPWLPNLAIELLSFPNGEHDDQIDSITQFLRYARNLKLPQVRRASSIRPKVQTPVEISQSGGRARAYDRARSEEPISRFGLSARVIRERSMWRSGL